MNPVRETVSAIVGHWHRFDCFDLTFKGIGVLRSGHERKAEDLQVHRTQPFIHDYKDRLSAGFRGMDYEIYRLAPDEVVPARPYYAKRDAQYYVVR